MRTINLIVVHCSATKNGRKIGMETETAAEAINRMHGERRPPFLRSRPVGAAAHLKHIGYHYVIDLDGTVHTGRDESEVGAHVSGFNDATIGICMVGTDKYTRAQWAALAGLVRALSRRYQVPVAPPQRKPGLITRKTLVVNGVCGHRDLSPDQNRNGVIESFEWLKTCPGFVVSEWLEGGLQPLQNNMTGVGL